MKNSVKLNGIVLFIALITTILIYNCGSDTVTNTPNTPAIGTLSGTITFTDTNKVDTNGYYDVSVYTSWPPAAQPPGSDTIKFTRTNGVYTGTFTIKGLESGRPYWTVAAYIHLPYISGSSVYVLGLRGCDNNEACYMGPGAKSDTLPSNQGLAGVDFKAFLNPNLSHVRF